MDDVFLREDSVKDIDAFLGWVKDEDDLDESRVIVNGGSYGGYMVLACLCHYSEKLLGGIERVGISNFVTFLENTAAYRRNLRRVEYGDERIEEVRDFLNKISPLNNAHLIRKPLFITQGLNDPRVPASESIQIIEKVRENGLFSWYLSADDEGNKKLNK